MGKKYYFETILENLGIDSKYMSMDPVNNDSKINIVKKCENHPFIKKKIKKNHQERLIFRLFNQDMLIGKLICLIHERPAIILPVISKDQFLSNYQRFLNPSFLNISTDFGKVIGTKLFIHYD